jgi:hypothetical protein
LVKRPLLRVLVFEPTLYMGRLRCVCRALDCGHGHGRRRAARVAGGRQRPCRRRPRRSVRARRAVRGVQRPVLELRGVAANGLCPQHAQRAFSHCIQ